VAYSVTLRLPDADLFKSPVIASVCCMKPWSLLTNRKRIFCNLERKTEFRFLVWPQLGRYDKASNRFFYRGLYFFCFPELCVNVQLIFYCPTTSCWIPEKDIYLNSCSFFTVIENLNFSWPIENEGTLVKSRIATFNITQCISESRVLQFC
jgi:hypothetical protein